MSYTRIVYRERVEIVYMLARKQSCREIAQALKRSVSSISEEVKHNRFNSKYYDPEYADMKVQKHKKTENKAKYKYF